MCTALGRGPAPPGSPALAQGAAMAPSQGQEASGTRILRDLGIPNPWGGGWRCPGRGTGGCRVLGHGPSRDTWTILGHTDHPGTRSIPGHTDHPKTQGPPQTISSHCRDSLLAPRPTSPPTISYHLLCPRWSHTRLTPWGGFGGDSVGGRGVTHGSPQSPSPWVDPNLLGRTQISLAKPKSPWVDPNLLRWTQISLGRCKSP